MPERELIRVSAPADQPAVADLVTAAFGGEHGPVVARLVDALRASPAWDPALSFVAESAPAGARPGQTPADAGPSQLTGYVLLTRNLLDAPRRLVDVLVLSPLAVRPGHQGHGIGSRLVRHALAAAEAGPEPLVFLEARRTSIRGSASRRAGTEGSAARRSASPSRPSWSGRCPATSPG